MDPELTCQRLRASLPRPGAPADLGSLARAAGVTHVRLEPIEIDGMLVPTVHGLVAIVSTRISRSRQRFTLAHEVGHAALGTTSAECFASSSEGARGERDANRFASEALLPEAEVRRAVMQRAVDADAVARLMKRYRVSVESAARRVIDLGLWRAVFVVWRMLLRPGSTRKLRVDWAVKPPNQRIYIPRFAPAPPALCEQWEAGRSGRTMLVLALGSLRGTHLVESVCGEETLYSFISLARQTGDGA